jgi:ABC-type nitrate/sulfonate/bicarbonate transport system substrate-binding protein
MNRRVNQWIVALLILVTAVCATALWLRATTNGSGDDRSAQATRPTSKVVRIGYVSTGLTGVAVREMRLEHTNAPEGYTVELVPFTDPSALNQSFTAGGVDINVAASLPVVLNARAKGHDIKYFQTTLLNSVSVVVKKSSSVNSILDARGKKIGWYGQMNGGGSGFLVLAKMNGVDPLKQIRLVQAPPAVLPRLLENGEVDGIVVFEPFVTSLLDDGRYRSVMGPFTDEWAKHYNESLELSGMAASQEWLERNKGFALWITEKWTITAMDIRSDFDSVVQRNKKELGLNSLSAQATFSRHGSRFFEERRLTDSSSLRNYENELKRTLDYASATDGAASPFYFLRP